MEGAGRVLPTACAGTGQAGPRSCAKWPVPSTLCKPTPRSHTSFSRPRAFPGCLALCCSPSSEFLRPSLHIPASCVWVPSWRIRGQLWKIAPGVGPSPTPAGTMSQTLALVLLAQDCAARWREKTGLAKSESTARKHQERGEEKG